MDESRSEEPLLHVEQLRAMFRRHPVLRTEVANCIQLDTDTGAVISRAEFETENGFEIQQDDFGALSAKKAPQEHQHEWTIPTRVFSATFQEFLQQSHE